MSADTNIHRQEGQGRYRASSPHPFTSPSLGDASSTDVSGQRMRIVNFQACEIAKGGRCCLPFARTGNECRLAERAPSGVERSQEQSECQELHVVSRSVTPGLPCFPRCCVDELGGTRLNRICCLIDALLQVVEFDAGALRELAITASDRVAQRYP